MMAQSPPPPVLLVLPAESRPKITLLRAQALARRAAAPLRVVVCLPPSARVNALFPQRNLMEAASGLEDERRAAKRVWRWTNRTVATALEPEAIVTHRGSLVECAVAEAKARNAQLVVISANDLGSAGEVARIVEASGVSVLVARQARAQNRVVAATNLVFASLPVLRRGAELARSLGASLTFVHNVPGDPSIPSGRRGDRERAWRALDDTRVDRSSNLLSWAVEDLGVDAEATVVERADTSEAILEMARAKQADLVVVGHRRRSWISRLFQRAVDEVVVRRASQSVAVVPLDAAGVVLSDEAQAAPPAFDPRQGGSS